MHLKIDSKALIGRYIQVSIECSIQNGLRQGDALLPLLFSLSLEYTIKKTRKTSRNAIGHDQLSVLMI
jgi:hypothetical protein